VRRFLLQVVASWAVVGGLALLGAGPRAAAGTLFLPGPGAAGDLGAADLGPTVEAAPAVAFPTVAPSGPQDGAPLGVAFGLTCHTAPATTGGSTRAPTRSGEGQSAFLPGPAPEPPPPTGLLRIRPEPDLSAPVLPSIFHPPRLAS
jgi:hypothetical protein